MIGDHGAGITLIEDSVPCRINQKYLQVALLNGIHNRIVDMCITEAVSDHHETSARPQQHVAKLLMIPAQDRKLIDADRLLASHDKDALSARPVIPVS